MGTLANGTVVAPFANAAMRLLREDWKGKYGSKMLAEELFPILQTGIPQPDQNFQNFITINAGEDNKFASLIDKFGNKLFEIDAFKGVTPIEPPGYPPPKLKPRIVWAAKTITAGSSISAGELDAVAVDPETGVEVAGAYVYNPTSGTTFSSAGTTTLYVNFTPTDGVKYRKAMGSTVLTITGSSKTVPDLNWPLPADINVGTALSGTQLNATAADPITSDPVPGIFTSTPPSGTVLSAGDGQNLHVDFVPTDTVTYASTSADVSINVKAPIFTGAHFASANGTSVSGSALTGELLVVVVGGKGTIGTVSDTASNTYTQLASSTSAGYTIAIFYARQLGIGALTVSTSGSDVTIAFANFRYLTAATLASSTDNVTVTNPAQSTVSLSVGTIPVTGANTVVVGAWLGSQTAGQAIDANAGATGWSNLGTGTVTTSGKENVFDVFYKVGVSSSQTPAVTASCNAASGNAVSVGVGGSFR